MGSDDQNGTARGADHCPTSADTSTARGQLCIYNQTAAGQWNGQLELADKSTHWALTLQYTPNNPAAANSVSEAKLFAPRFANQPSETLTASQFKWNGQSAIVELSWRPAQGGYDLISYRVTFELIDNDWRLVRYTTSYRHADKTLYRVNDSDLIGRRLYNCESNTPFSCIDAKRSTPLVEQPLPRLSAWPGLLDYAPKPNVPTMIR